MPKRQKIVRTSLQNDSQRIRMKLIQRMLFPSLGICRGEGKSPQVITTLSTKVYSKGEYTNGGNKKG